MPHVLYFREMTIAFYRVTCQSRLLSDNIISTIQLLCQAYLGDTVNAIKKAAKYIYKNPGKPGAKVLADLAVAIETNKPYALAELYELSHDEFELAIGMLKDWRIDRHYLSKLKMLEIGEMEALLSPS